MMGQHIWYPYLAGTACIACKVLKTPATVNTPCPGPPSEDPPTPPERPAEDMAEAGSVEPLEGRMAHEMITIGGRKVRRFIQYPATVRDGTVRCISCGQIDELPWHDMAVCDGIRAERFAALAEARG